MRGVLNLGQTWLWTPTASCFASLPTATSGSCCFLRASFHALSGSGESLHHFKRWRDVVHHQDAPADSLRRQNHGGTRRLIVRCLNRCVCISCVVCACARSIRHSERRKHGETTGVQLLYLRTVFPVWVFVKKMAGCVHVQWYLVTLLKVGFSCGFWVGDETPIALLEWRTRCELACRMCIFEHVL